MKEDITKRIDDLNDELVIRQESIDLLKGRLKSQITSFKETIAKVLDKDTSLGEKIRTLFREQGIMIASILTAIRMAIGVLVEALLPGGGDAVSGGPPSKDEKGLKEWITVHYSFFPNFDFFKKICCFLHWIQSANLHFLLPYIINGSPYICDS